ncbi:unnamed protein product [Moneuplotes crassus]|uniref:Uncharacterized protein n=1 Tax=Euplotes crassus TaxID=5936 RepID=A0AAD1X7Y2_EUPCR|nr:unnamed protein product [Moneuplotes crassus]
MVMIFKEVLIYCFFASGCNPSYSLSTIFKPCRLFRGDFGGIIIARFSEDLPLLSGELFCKNLAEVKPWFICMKFHFRSTAFFFEVMTKRRYWLQSAGLAGFWRLCRLCSSLLAPFVASACICGSRLSLVVFHI